MPGSRAPPVSRSTHAFGANAQAFFNKMFDAIEGQRIPIADTDLGFGFAIHAATRGAECVVGALVSDPWRFAMLSEVLEEASAAWKRVTTPACSARSARGTADLWIAADDAAEDEEKLAMLLDEETAERRRHLWRCDRPCCADPSGAAAAGRLVGKKRS